MEFFNYTIMFAQGEALSYTGTLEDVAVKAIELNTEKTVLCIRPEGKLYIMYFNENAFTAFANEDMLQSELLNITGCTGLYRNTTALKVVGGEVADAGSLWMRKGNKLELIDDDLAMEADIYLSGEYFDKLV